MKKRSSAQQVPPADRLGYLWLTLGIIFSLFAANGRWALPLAAWLGPLFLLRFARTRGPITGFLGAWLATMGTSLFFLYGAGVLVPLYIIAYLSFGTVLALPYLLDRLITPRLSLVSGPLASLIFPLGRVTSEYLISHTLFGSILPLAYTQYGNLPLLQILSVTGIYGVSFLMTWFASVANWIWEQHFAWPRIRTITLLYSGLLTLVLLGGSLRLAFFPPSAQLVRVAGVDVSSTTLQRALSPFATREAIFQADPAQVRSAFGLITDELLALSQREARAGAKIIVWPEISGKTLAQDKASLIERGKTLARQEHVYLEMGLLVLFQTQATYQNQTVLIDPQGREAWIYNKSYPVQGAETFAPGDRNIRVADTPYGRISNVICFDADVPDLMQKTGNKGIDIMLIPGSDSLETDHFHAQDGTFRAIEYGYSMVRPATESVSLTVDYQGHVLAATDYFTTDEHIMIAYVPVKGIWTIYGAVGDLFTWLCIASLIGLTALGVSRSLGKAESVLTPMASSSAGNAEERHEVGTL